MVSIMDYMQKDMNVSYMTNGAKMYQTSNSFLVDYLATAGSIRYVREKMHISLFEKAYAEDKRGALRLLFFIHDIREGLGERQHFRLVLQHLATIDEKVLLKNIHLVPTFGRWDDLFGLIKTSEQVTQAVLHLITKQLQEDFTQKGESTANVHSAFLMCFYRFSAVLDAFDFFNVTIIPKKMKTMPITCVVVGRKPVKIVSNKMATPGSKNTKAEISRVGK